ncbi:class I SAM-dependent RNA methyltransferase [Nocardioides sp. Bht2]|uniref:class I SAM-dependent RNA methyltransferase n=1 Tax=Nocardioides sp. Bht2 TaxID=3392297 RepID=UPI0039B57526
MARTTRQRKARGASLVGRRFQVEIGAVAHGGHCVGRIAELGDRVAFVRHTLPGETVEIEITEGTEGDRFLRADAVKVLVPSADRVPAPCVVAGPGGCGGCDFQHVALLSQRRLKESVVREQLVRLGGFDPADPLVADLEVQAVPGDQDGLRWRSRVEYARTPDGHRGMRAHRSRRVVPIDDCLIAATDARVASEVRGSVIIERVRADSGERAFEVEGDGFWQVHPGAPRTLVDCVTAFAGVREGDRVVDLYSGVGLFSGFLGAQAGSTGSVALVEGSRNACEHAGENLADLDQVEIYAGSVDQVLEAGVITGADVVVLDPPREGAKRAVVEQIHALGPRTVVYVACDPAALARDLKIFGELGWSVTDLKSYDLFPMTHHVETVARLTRTGA